MADGMVGLAHQVHQVPPQEACQPVMAMPMEIQICMAENGFMVYIGCKIFVGKTWAEVSTGLGEYFKDPSKAEKKYCKKGD